jgi:hypothetical protein
MKESGGVGLATVIGIVFIILKLVGVIAWSWWWVLSPFWIPLGLALVIAIVSRIVILITKI